MRLRVGLALRLLAPLIAAPFCCPSLDAQRIRIVQAAPDCDVRRRAYDNPFDDSRGYWQPRIAWHAEKAVAGFLATSLLVRVGMPRRIARIIPALVVTALHVRGVIRRTYDLDPLDWVADAWTVSAASPRPLVWVLGYVATGICFASP